MADTRAAHTYQVGTTIYAVNGWSAGILPSVGGSVGYDGQVRYIPAGTRWEPGPKGDRWTLVSASLDGAGSGGFAATLMQLPASLKASMGAPVLGVPKVDPVDLALGLVLPNSAASLMKLTAVPLPPPETAVLINGPALPIGLVRRGEDGNFYELDGDKIHPIPDEFTLLNRYNWGSVNPYAIDRVSLAAYTPSYAVATLKGGTVSQGAGVNPPPVDTGAGSIPTGPLGKATATTPGTGVNPIGHNGAQPQHTTVPGTVLGMGIPLLFLIGGVTFLFLKAHKHV